MSKTDIEEQAFDATNQIMRLVGETHIGGTDQLNAKIHVFITKVLEDVAAAAQVPLLEENASMRAAIDQTIAWQQSVDASNTESVRLLLGLDTPASDAAINDLRANGLDLFRDAYLIGVAKDLATSFSDMLRRGGA